MDADATRETQVIVVEDLHVVVQDGRCGNFSALAGARKGNSPLMRVRSNAVLDGVPDSNVMSRRRNDCGWMRRSVRRRGQP